MEHKIIVVAIVKNGNKILVGKKIATKENKDTWFLPGGHVDFDMEDMDRAVEREITEESGLRVYNIKRDFWETYIKKDPEDNNKEKHYVFLCYVCNYASGEVNPGSDMSDFQWAGKKELREYRFNQPISSLLKKHGYATSEC